MKVSKINIQKWCNALRSGEYKQGTFSLQPSSDTFCCLGVACKVFINESDLRLHLDGLLIGGLPSTQPRAPKWLAKINKDFLNNFDRSLTNLNDIDNFTFEEIADCLELVYIHKALS